MDNKKKYLLVLSISLIIGGIFTLLFYKAKLGINGAIFAFVFFAAVLYIISKLKIKLKKISYFYISSILIFSILNVFTMNSKIVLINVMIIFIDLIIIVYKNAFETDVWSFKNSFKGMCYAVGQLLINMTLMVIDGINIKSENKQNKKHGKKNNIKYVFIGILISVPFVLILGALLCSADEVFSSMIKNLRLDINVLSILSDFIYMLFTSLIVSLLFYSFVVTISNSYDILENVQSKKINGIIAITLNSIILFMYIVFSFIQVKYLFLGNRNVLPSNMTYSEYAREGFFSLLVVTIINVIILIVSRCIFEEGRILKSILFCISFCTFIMILSSAYRMKLYIDEYYLTFTRVLVLWCLVLITFLIIGILIYIWNEKFNIVSFSSIIIIIFCIALSSMRIDSIVCNYNLDHMDLVKDKMDIVYMIDNLSCDASFNKIDKKIQKLDDIDAKHLFSTALNSKRERVESEYNNRDIRGFNHSLYKSEMEGNKIGTVNTI